MVPIIGGHSPAGCAIKQLIHYGQNINTECFQKFDFGRRGNLLQYNTVKPPKYNLDNVTSRIVLYYSKADGVVFGECVKSLEKDLANASSYYIPQNYFEHGDYVWRTDAKATVYGHLLSDLNAADRLTLL